MITTAELGQQLARARKQRKMSLRDVTDETGVSASTLSRIENGIGAVDAHNVAILASYLSLPLERVKGDKFVYLKGEPLPQVVDALINTDERLSDRARSSLSLIFEHAYQAVSEMK